MKIALVFLLVGVSSIHAGFTTYGPKVEPCLAKALTTDARATIKSLLNFLCCYINKNGDVNVEELKTALRDLRTTLRDAGCGVDDILGTTAEFDKLLNGLGELIKNVGLNLANVVNGIPAIKSLLAVVFKYVGCPTLNLLDKLLLDKILADPALQKLLNSLADFLITILMLLERKCLILAEAMYRAI
ncbi:uncharacterized protein LOC144769215 [Lissotriton helveticus]